MNAITDDELFGAEAASREMDARIEHALTKNRNLVQLTEDAKKELEEEDNTPTDEQVEMFRRVTLARATTPEWHLVLDRIDRGHLTWRQIMESVRAGKLDPEVERAFDSLRNVPVLPPEQMKALSQEVHAEFAPPEPPAEEPAEQEKPEPPAPPETSSGSRWGVNDDDDDDDQVGGRWY